MLVTKREVPYASAVVVEEFEKRKTKQFRRIFSIFGQ